MKAAKCQNTQSESNSLRNSQPVEFTEQRADVLHSGAEVPGFESQPRLLSGNSLRQTVHTYRASVHQPAKLVAALLRVARVTAGLAESNGSLPPGL